YQNDFNWKVAPSDTGTKEFAQIKKLVEETLKTEKLLFYFAAEKDLLKEFIKNNFAKPLELFPDAIIQAQIDKTNFTHVYKQWTQFVKPSILIAWDRVKPYGIIDADFYLADLISADDITLKDQLFVTLKKDKYELDRRIDEFNLISSRTVELKDKGKAHKAFWKKYARPPLKEFWDYIVARRDLLIPEDIRERKGAFFTPPQWAAKAHEYLEKCFGENWQDEYIIWDNSAGTGNLLENLKNKDNIWASTLDKQDVQVMRDRIQNGLNLWENQVFQFDFLNDDLKPLREGGKIPNPLFDILSNQEKRKKLIFLINPPYGEVATAATRTGRKTNKDGVQESNTKDRFKETLGIALKQKFIQFFARILFDIPDCKIGAFVKPIYICGSNMKKFREAWKGAYLGGFATPARTHDNCTGEYPICFFIWDLAQKKNFPKSVPVDVFNAKEEYKGLKKFYASEHKTINDWLISTRNRPDEKVLGFLNCNGVDVQHDKYVYAINDKKQLPNPRGTWITDKNLLEVGLYFSARHCIEHTWINDADQYFYPKSGWEGDGDFQNDCLVYMLFHSYLKIKFGEGVNHWIPFSEGVLGASCRFESRFMGDFLGSRGIHFREGVFTGVSPGAGAVLGAGLAVWRYYFETAPEPCLNASFYDIREYFQRKSRSGKMGVSSEDERYNALIKTLRDAQAVLAAGIAPKVYEYGFLLGD
ncbi:MAG: hypothetical protein LBG90_07550, partial [Spirochaetaceae bacterium]|nr:hypothetical protein [Spirochaetaceae bacterium]